MIGPPASARHQDSSTLRTAQVTPRVFFFVCTILRPPTIRPLREHSV
jgi:hypothetical protein